MNNLLFKVFALALLSALLLALPKHARDIVPALDSQQIVEPTDADDLASDELELW